MIQKPMLAAAVSDIGQLKFPLLASPKIDGIRAISQSGHLVSRTLKPIPNEHIRKVLEGVLPEGADGEIVSGNSFQSSSSAVMRITGKPDFEYCMFDLYSPLPYERRVEAYQNFCTANPHPNVTPVPVTLLATSDALEKYEATVLEQGFEGVMLREPGSPYKFGRSTLRQGWLLKLKRFTDAEARIIGYEEAYHNANPALTDHLGHTTRSTAKDGKIPAGRLGSFFVIDLESGIEFNVGSGFTMAQREEIWDDPEGYIGKIVKYRYQPTGVKEAPRFPVFIGFRDEIDM